MKFYYTYVLRSKKDTKLYYGQTKNLKLRIEQHNEGKVTSTKFRRPLELIYFEGCMALEDALKREKYFKTYYGRMFIKKRLLNYFTKNNSYSTG
jgi:putative endonuclease